MRTYISQFTHKGQEIEVLYHKGELRYIFEVKGKRYGGAVKAQGKSIQDIMNATAALIIQYLDTREAVEVSGGAIEQDDD